MRVQLKDIASFSKGKQINGDDLVDGGQYVFLNGGINPSGKWNEYNVEGNSIAISEGGNSCGYVNYMSEPFWCGAHCYFLYDLKYDAKYTYYALKSQQDRIMQLRSGACMPNIKKNSLGEFSFLIEEDIAKQALVVASLDKVSELIALRKEQLAKLDQLVKSRFIELFGDPITNSNNLPTERMELRFNLKAGITTAADDIHEFEEGMYEIPCYGGNGIRGYVREKSYTGNYPIIGRQGALCGNVQYATGEFHATEHAVLVSLLKNDNSVWVYHLLKLMDLFRYHTGAAQPGLAVKTLNTVEVIVADKRKQDQFAAFVEQTDKSKLAIQQSLDKLELLKKSLIQQYFG